MLIDLKCTIKCFQVILMGGSAGAMGTEANCDLFAGQWDNIFLDSQRKTKCYMCVIRSSLQTDSTPKDPTWTSGVSRTAAASILSKTTHNSATLNFSSMQPLRLIHIKTNTKHRTGTPDTTLSSSEKIYLCTLSRFGTQFLTNPALLQTPQD